MGRVNIIAVVGIYGIRKAASSAKLQECPEKGRHRIAVYDLQMDSAGGHADEYCDIRFMRGVSLESALIDRGPA